MDTRSTQAWSSPTPKWEIPVSGAATAPTSFSIGADPHPAAKQSTSEVIDASNTRHRFWSLIFMEFLDVRFVSFEATADRERANPYASTRPHRREVRGSSGR